MPKMNRVKRAAINTDKLAVKGIQRSKTLVK